MESASPCGKPRISSNPNRTMARGRLISRTLGSSRSFAALHQAAGRLGEFAQALYPMLVANADDFGRQAGDAFTVKMAVFPSSPRKEEEFAAVLTAMCRAGLVQLYDTPKGQVLQIVKFDEHQPGLSKRTESKFDEPPVNFTGLPGNSKAIELNRTELNLTEPKGTALRAGLDGFESFWAIYPRKKSRAAAEKAWLKVAPDSGLAQRILDAVAAQRKSPEWTKDGGQFVPHAATWLNGRRWEDEVEQAPTLALVPVPEIDWFDECKALHGRTCSDRLRHHIRMRAEAS